ncbi:DUF3192 domain-containing protein [Ferrimonas gelatinilytica]|uniref:DUF3192 domain-containing protein n=1 Tax=Ferrimonas gelatinilytica TaxID=1255257 RepID=A0ABP9S2E7_9GAMM
MKKTILAATLAAMAITSLSGCVVKVGGDGGWDADHLSSWEKQQERNRKNLAQISLGMTVDQVRVIMGTADFNEVYQKDQGVVQVLYYRTHRLHGDGVTEKEECTPVVFRDGAVTGWGETAVNLAI